MQMEFCNWIWENSEIILKLPGWMGAVGGQTFSGLPTDVRLCLSQGSGWPTQGFDRVVAKPLVQWLRN